MIDMSDFEQWIQQNSFGMEHANGDIDLVASTEDIRKYWQAAKQSMIGESNFDLAAGLTAVADMGFWPQVIYDDNGNWAIWDEGSANMRLDDDMDYHCSFLIPAEYFKPSLQDAWSSYVERLKELGNDVSKLHSNAKQSMQGEAVGVVIHADDISQPDTSGEHKGKYQNMVYSHAPLQAGSHVYTHAPDSAARIAELEAENEALRKDADRYRTVREFVGAYKRHPDFEYRFQLKHLNPVEGADLFKGSVAQHFDEAIDASLNIKGGAE